MFVIGFLILFADTIFLLHWGSVVIVLLFHINLDFLFLIKHLSVTSIRSPLDFASLFG